MAFRSASTSRRSVSVAGAIAALLPRGGVLPLETWQARHHGIRVVLWVHVAALVLIGAQVGVPALTWSLSASAVAACTVLAGSERLGRTARSSLATLGLLLCSAILIGYFDGLIEAHFHFFIAIAVVSLYQAWSPYLLAVGFVLAHHLVLGTAMPHLVYNHHMAAHHPWWFALVHAGAVLTESLACLAFWRVTEDALDSERTHRNALEDANAELSAASTAVADLVAMLSHDLRSPLTVLIGFSDLAAQRWPQMTPEEQVAFVGMVNRRARGLHALLEDTLTVSALDGDGVEPHPVAVDLDRAVREALANLPDAPAGVDLRDLAGHTAWVDRGHLGQVLTNLLTNSFKYGSEPIVVSATSDGETTSLRISDHGPGVEPSFVPHLFDRFTRADEARTSGRDGTGLGLYITRRLLRVNGGDVAYEQVPGRGATFHITLPRDDGRAGADPDHRGLARAIG